MNDYPTGKDDEAHRATDASGKGLAEWSEPQMRKFDIHSETQTQDAASFEGSGFS